MEKKNFESTHAGKNNTYTRKYDDDDDDVPRGKIDLCGAFFIVSADEWAILIVVNTTTSFLFFFSTK